MEANSTRRYRGTARVWALLIGVLLTGMALGFGLGLLVNDAKAVDEPEATDPAQAEVLPEEKPVCVEVEVEPEEPQKEIVRLGEFKLTHYCPCEKCCGKTPDHPAYGITSSGTVATEGRTIAVDPSVIPYGTEVIIVYEDGTTATYIAEDCGGSIKNNRIDIYMDSHQAALEAGVKMAEVYIVEV